jgi:hypothetical protein
MNDKTCNTCRANKICDHNKYGFENCGNHIPSNEELVKRFKNILLTQEHSKEDIQLIMRYAESLIDDYLPEIIDENIIDKFNSCGCTSFKFLD